METKQKRRKVIVSLLALAGLLAFSLVVYGGGSLEPSAPPGPIMKTLDEVEPRIPIHASDLPLTITEPNSYYLAETINFSDLNTDAITIECNDVTIDLAGYHLIGPGKAVGTTGIGICMNGRGNVEIRNGTVRDFRGYGIREVGGSGKQHRVINVRMVSNGVHGILLYGSGHLVKDCTAAKNGNFGIYTIGNGCTITGNIAYNNQFAGVSYGPGSTVTGNTAYDNGGNGIYGSNLGSTVSGNTAYNNGLHGISDTGGSTVTGNTAYNNQLYGIAAGYGSTVTGNTAYNNQQHGIAAGYGSTVTGNTAYFNQYNGIYLVSNSLVDQNTANSNNQSGGNYTNIRVCGSCTFGLNHAL